MMESSMYVCKGGSILLVFTLADQIIIMAGLHTWLPLYHLRKCTLYYLEYSTLFTIVLRRVEHIYNMHLCTIQYIHYHNSRTIHSN